MAEKSGGTACGVIVLAIVVFFIAGGYGAIQKAGWIPHSVKAEVTYPQKGWEVGEYVECAAVSSDGTRTFLDCSGGIFSEGAIREMDVKFWGGAGKDVVLFKCQRGEDVITCHLADK
jgi:hypothetical protein